MEQSRRNLLLAARESPMQQPREVLEARPGDGSRGVRHRTREGGERRLSGRHLRYASRPGSSGAIVQLPSFGSKATRKAVPGLPASLPNQRFSTPGRTFSVSPGRVMTFTATLTKFAW